MDFDSAIVAHSRWKRRLNAAVAGGDEALDPATIRRDDQCELGRWLKGEGKVLSARPEYTQLVKCHAEFHTCAGHIADHIVRGERDAAQKLLTTESQFMRTSATVVMLIASMRDGVAATAAR